MSQENSPYKFSPEVRYGLSDFSEDTFAYSKIVKQLMNNVRTLEKKSKKIVRTTKRLEKYYTRYHDLLENSEKEVMAIHIANYKAYYPYTQGRFTNLTLDDQKALKEHLASMLTITNVEADDLDTEFRVMYQNILGIDYDHYKAEKFALVIDQIGTLLKNHGINLPLPEGQPKTIDAGFVDKIIAAAELHYKNWAEVPEIKSNTPKWNQRNFSREPLEIAQEELQIERTDYILTSKAHLYDQLAQIAQVASLTDARIQLNREAQLVKLEKKENKIIFKIYETLVEILSHDAHMAGPDRENPDAVLIDFQQAFKEGNLKKVLFLIEFEWLECKFDDIIEMNEARKIKRFSKVLDWHIQLLDIELMRVRMQPKYRNLVDQMEDYPITSSNMLDEDLVQSETFKESNQAMTAILQEAKAPAFKAIKALIEQNKRFESHFDAMQELYWDDIF